MIFKKTLKIILKIVLGFIAFIALYAFSAWLLSRVSVAKETSSQPLNIAVYILTNGVHTDVVLPVKSPAIDWSTMVKYQNSIGKDTSAQFVAMGWGDKDFYLNTPTWSQLKFNIAFKAVFALSNAAIHTTFYKRLSEDESCKKIMISNSQYLRLVNYLKSSFKTDSAGNFINIKTNANYNNDDAFYEAKGRYNPFYTCNTWTNNALKACGQKACLWTPFDSGIFRQYR